MKKEKLSAEYTVVALRTRNTGSLGRHCASSVTFALSLLKLTLAAGLAFGIAGCGTKTELLKPDGKPTPKDERDPSQPPSPISR